MKTLVVLVCSILLASTSPALLLSQSVQIPYQGYIAAQTGKPYNGTFQFEFAIVIGSTQQAWNSGTVSLPVKDGIYSVILGATGQPVLNSSLFINNPDTRLRISFTDGVKGMETLSPDVQLLPVPYAVHAKYADTSFVQTALPPMDSLVLRDSRGVVRMVMNPNTGTFSMKNNDTTWYSISVNSPPAQKYRFGDYTSEVKEEADGSTSVTTTDNKTGKTVESSNTRYDPTSNSVVQDQKTYDKDGKVKTETTKATKSDGTETEKYTTYGEDGKTKAYESESKKKDGKTTEKWKEFNEKGETESSGERTSENGETTGSKKYDKDGNLTEEYTSKDGKSTWTYYTNGKVTSKHESEETKEGSKYTRTKYDENGNPVSQFTQSNVNGHWTWGNKNLKENKSSSNEPSKSTEKSGNSATTTEPGKIEFKTGTNTFGLGIDSLTGSGQLTYTNSLSTDASTVTFGGGASTGTITIDAPKVKVETKEIKIESPGSGGGTILCIVEPGPITSSPRLEMQRLSPPNFNQRTTLEWNPQNQFGVTLTDSSSGNSTGLLWDPVNRSIGSTHDFTIGGNVKSDTIKPRTKSGVTFSTGITVNGQSNFGNTIDIAGAAQIQQNGTFTGSAAVVQNATVQQQLRTNQIFPITPSNTVTINGNLNVVGNLTKGGGNFKIDHPLDPYNKYLIHSFVESPERTNIYSGNVITDELGKGIVQLPDYFEAANNDFRYQLTVIGADARAYVLTEIESNIFTIQASIPNVKVSWQVTSTRVDNFAKSNQYDPEQEKEPGMKGTLLYPIQE